MPCFDLVQYYQQKTAAASILLKTGRPDRLGKHVDLANATKRIGPPTLPEMEDDPPILFLRQRIHADPQNCELRLQMASALFDRKRIKEALSEIQRARPDHASRDKAMSLQRRILELLD